MASTRQRPLTILLLTALALVVVTYRDSFAAIVHKWGDDASFSHGYIILPIVLWLAWRKRAELASVSLRPSWLGLVVILGCCGLWIVARGAGVLALEQLAVVGMLAALVVAVLGVPAARVLAFPLAFLFFAVPFGRAVVPPLMHLTADVATVALQWSGVPVYRAHMLIMIPGGRFEVARACSGLNFVMTGLVLGVLYAHLSFRSWSRRLLCVAAFVAIPILANGVRVYSTILMSHLTDMRFGPGAEHVTFGRIFFIAVLLLLILAARRWHEDAGTAVMPAPTAQAAEPQRPMSARALAPAFVALIVLLSTPAYLSQSLAATKAMLADGAPLVTLPDGESGWDGPIRGGDSWRPLYRDSVQEQVAVYRAPRGGSVDVFVAVYGLGTSLGAEMISYENVLFAGEHNSLAESDIRTVRLGGTGGLLVREVVVPHGGSSMLVWSWFMVGDRRVTSEYTAKALEAAAFVFRTADSERIITLATPLDDEGRERLRAFVAAHASCVGGGFAPEACTG